jgi:hypothetical protein
MLPCKYCEGHGGQEVVGTRGLKQAGRLLRDGAHWGRRYFCLDCGATLEMTGPGGAQQVAFESWLPTGGDPVRPAEPPATGKRLRGRFPARWFGDWCTPARARQPFWVRCDSVGTSLLPEVSVRDRTGAAAGLVTFRELATIAAAAKGRSERPRVFRVQPGALERLLADPREASETARREGRPLLMDPRDLGGRIPLGRRA